ncbi:MAG TPA: enoyl-CoA hydratase-related protein [Bdellovibrionota bacterium]|nr:enoyl-CoA hydratase-related protein [Bdellovibrionota bacterium]
MAVLETKISERIATIIFNRPDSLNALNLETLEFFHTTAKELAERKDVSVIVVTGAGEKAFIAGADIKHMQSLSPLQASRFGKLGQDCLFALENAPQITIAAVNGFALGGGCEFAMGCDLIYASEKAKFGQPEVNLGITPGFGGSQRLPRLVGPMKAREMIYTGEMIDAQEALRIGLVARVFPAAEFLGKVMEVAKTIASKGPEAIRRSKVMMRDGLGTDLVRGCAIERDHFALCFAHPDQKEGMSAFLEKRKPNWRD